MDVELRQRAHEALDRIAQLGAYETASSADVMLIADYLKVVETRLEELRVTESLLSERQRVLEAIPPCSLHGPCVPHALEWIARAKTLLTTKEGSLCP